MPEQLSRARAEDPELALLFRPDGARDAAGRLELGEQPGRLGLGDPEQLGDQRGVSVAILVEERGTAIELRRS